MKQETLSKVTLLALVAVAAIIISFGMTLGPDRFAGLVAVVMLLAIGGLEYRWTWKRGARIRNLLGR